MKPLKGANPVPGPIIIIGTFESDGSLKLDCLTKMGAQLLTWESSNDTAFCKGQQTNMITDKDVILDTTFTSRFFLSYN